jgi:hypothetical protein
MTDSITQRYPDALPAQEIFEREVGASISDLYITQVGTEKFLTFEVGREAPIYHHALAVTQASLPSENEFKGRLRLSVKPVRKFPESLEASCLLTLLTRSTRAVTEGRHATGFMVPYVPFQNREDHILSQPASHVVLGRRGVGKSTLIIRAVDLLSQTDAVFVVLDMQAYDELGLDDAIREIALDLVIKLREASAAKISGTAWSPVGSALDGLEATLSSRSVPIHTLGPSIKRVISKITTETKSNVFAFLDDFHRIENSAQPEILNFLNGALKGAAAWLKVAGVRSLTNYYSSANRKGLQVPGDAQEISLDLTLENPEAAERHLKAILQSFLAAVGYSFNERVLPDAAFKRLVWANAGVPRDFLQMFARALEHSRRNRHSSVTVSDVNIAIGEFGQKKFQEMRDDAREDIDRIDVMIQALEQYCLDSNKVNAFLIKSEDSEERGLVRKLSDLRLVHLIHQSITPDNAGEKYEAFIVDYALFTGFRRRPNVREMIPSESQFKASELRKLPKVSRGFLDGIVGDAKGGVEVAPSAKKANVSSHRSRSRSNKKAGSGSADSSSKGKKKLATTKAKKKSTSKVKR